MRNAGTVVLLQAACFCACLLALPASPTAAGPAIPPERRFTDAWRSAGYPGTIPAPGRTVSVRDFGSVGDGLTNDYPAVMAALAALSNQAGVVFFPAGTYRIRSTVKMPPGAVLRGEGSERTSLTFDMPGHGISVARNPGGAYQPLVNGAAIHSRVVQVTNTLAFRTGDYAEIRITADPAWQGSDWARQAIGQIVQIHSVTGTMITLVNPLRLDYPGHLSPEIRPISPITECGIENLKIERLLAGTDRQRDNQFTIQFLYAARCWVRGVEGVNCFGGHVGIEFSTQIEVSGCYFHHAHDYDGGGSGYGVRLEYRTGECLIEDNIFRHLRHSMLVQAGANGNVFGYNYSCEPHWTSLPADTASEITCHGNYPHANLFEGNIVMNIQADNSHGANGPFNTFFRNRAEGYGINITDSVGSNQTLVCNECLKPLLASGYSLRGLHFERANQTQAHGMTPAGSSVPPDYSYYLGADPLTPPVRPVFWVVTNSLPAIGPPLPLKTPKSIPALERFRAGKDMTVPSVRP
jgi:hypothetical protein